MEHSHGRIREILPEYDPSTDFLFKFYPDSHTVLYAKGYFWEPGGHYKEEEAMLAHGVVVRVHAGKEIIDRIEANIKADIWPQIQHAFTCHQRMLFLLGLSGVTLAKGAFFFGSSTYRSAILDGFVDEHGNPLQQEVFSHEQPGEEWARHTALLTQAYELGGAHSFFTGVLSALAYSQEEVLEDLRPLFPNPDQSQMLPLLSNPDTCFSVPQEMKDRIQSVMWDAEQRMLEWAEQKSGQNRTRVLMKFIREGFPGGLVAAKDIYRRAIQESVQAQLTRDTNSFQSHAPHDGDHPQPK